MNPNINYFSSKNNLKYLILDTSSIFSGKFINIDNVKIITTSSVIKEISPGGKDYRNLQYLFEIGLKLFEPSKESIKKIKIISTKTGDISRLSETDIEILSLALDFKNNKKEISILTDDYSIQNISNYLKIDYSNISQIGIKKRFIWSYKCTGCGKKFNTNIKICSICGSEIKNYISYKKNINKFK
jgi:UPF0271 protein